MLNGFKKIFLRTQLDELPAELAEFSKYIAFNIFNLPVLNSVFINNILNEFQGCSESCIKKTIIAAKIASAFSQVKYFNVANQLNVEFINSQMDAEFLSKLYQITNEILMSIVKYKIDAQNKQVKFELLKALSELDAQITNDYFLKSHLALAKWLGSFFRHELAKVNISSDLFRAFRDTNGRNEVTSVCEAFSFIDIDNANQIAFISAVLEKANDINDEMTLKKVYAYPKNILDKIKAYNKAVNKDGCKQELINTIVEFNETIKAFPNSKIATTLDKILQDACLGDNDLSSIWIINNLCKIDSGLDFVKAVTADVDSNRMNATEAEVLYNETHELLCISNLLPSPNIGQVDEKKRLEIRNRYCKKISTLEEQQEEVAIAMKKVYNYMLVYIASVTILGLIAGTLLLTNPFTAPPLVLAIAAISIGILGTPLSTSGGILLYRFSEQMIINSKREKVRKEDGVIKGMATIINKTKIKIE